MAAPVLHLLAVDELATAPRGLVEPLAHALREDLEYARFGAVLPDLPRFGAPHRVLLKRLFSQGHTDPFELLFHISAPVGLGMKMAELVAQGSLVGRDPGRALVAGYFSHLAVDRALSPQTERLAERLRKPGETMAAARRRVEWRQALLHLRERTGRDPAGRPEFGARMRILKRKGLPLLSGVGGGIYEVVRVGCLEALGKAPEKSLFNRWVRGLYLFGAAMQSPLGLLAGLPKDVERVRQDYYKGADVDFAVSWDQALAEARRIVACAHEFLARGDFSSRARGRFLSEVPEGTLTPRS